MRIIEWFLWFWNESGESLNDLNDSEVNRGNHWMIRMIQMKRKVGPFPDVSSGDQGQGRNTGFQRHHGCLNWPASVPAATAATAPECTTPHSSAQISPAYTCYYTTSLSTLLLLLYKHRTRTHLLDPSENPHCDPDPPARRTRPCRELILSLTRVLHALGAHSHDTIHQNPTLYSSPPYHTI
jgi:hypothetical protein